MCISMATKLLANSSWPSILDEPCFYPMPDRSWPHLILTVLSKSFFMPPSKTIWHVISNLGCLFLNDSFHRWGSESSGNFKILPECKNLLEIELGPSHIKVSKLLRVQSSLSYVTLPLWKETSGRLVKYTYLLIVYIFPIAKEKLNNFKAT